jgi:hypothetical protein
MLTVLSQAEIDASNARKRFLYASAFTVDNLTAILMDTSRGGMGLHEETARAKAHAVIGWLKTITGVDVPDRRGMKESE